MTAPLSSLADHADERFTEAQRAKVAEFEAAPEPPEIALAHVIAQCEADIAYYGESDDPMAIGRVIGVREVLHVIGRQP